MGQPERVAGLTGFEVLAPNPEKLVLFDSDFPFKKEKWWIIEWTILFLLLCKGFI